MKKRSDTSEILKATLSGDLGRVKAAIAAGELLDTRDRDGRTCLFQAVVEGKKEIVSLLIENGAEVNAQDNELATPLHFAAREYNFEIAEMLIAAGAFIDARDAHGNTALAKAVFASRGRGELISLLIAKGANKESKNLYGMSPLDLAKSIGNYDVEKFIS